MTGTAMEKNLDFEKNQRVVTFLNREEVDFLDKMGKDALFTTGVKLSRAKLIAWLVEFIKKMNISGEGIKSETDFDNKLNQICQKNILNHPAGHGR